MSKANDFIIYSIILSFLLAVFAPMIYDVTTVNSAETLVPFKAVDNWNLFGFGKNTHYQYYQDLSIARWDEIHETTTANWENAFPIGVSVLISIAWLIALSCSLAFYLHPSLRNAKEIKKEDAILSIVTSIALLISVIGLIFWNYYANDLINNISIQDTNGSFVEFSNRVETGISISFLISMNIIALIVSIGNSYSIIKGGLLKGNKSFKIFKERKKELLLTFNMISTLGIALMPITMLAMVYKKSDLYTLLSNAGADQFHYALNSGNFFGFGSTSIQLDSCSFGCTTSIITINDWSSSIRNQFPQILIYLTLIVWVIGIITIIYDLKLKLSEKNIEHRSKITVTSYSLLAITIISSITTLVWGYLISQITHEVTYRSVVYQVELGLGIGFYLVMALNLTSLLVCLKIISELKEGKLLDKSSEWESKKEDEQKREVEEIISKNQVKRHELTRAQVGSIVVAVGLISSATYEYFFYNILNLKLTYLQAQFAIGFAGLMLFFKIYESLPISIYVKHSLAFAAGYNMIIAVFIISKIAYFDVLFIYSMSMIIHMVAFLLFLTKLE
ncbi:MAG: hypothetical protein ACTSYA_10830 [Candidatus Kariarchaeaceae archaeon]